MMSTKKVRFFFDARTSEGRHLLDPSREALDRAVVETVDLANRLTLNNMHYYPGSIIENKLEDDGPVTEMVYASKPFAHAEDVSGAFTGELNITLDKKDADLGVTVFEQMPDGRMFHLAYWLGRASYAGHPERRTLLTPGKGNANPVCNRCCEPSYGSRKPPCGSAGRRQKLLCADQLRHRKRCER